MSILQEYETTKKKLGKDKWDKLNSYIELNNNELSLDLVLQKEEEWNKFEQWENNDGKKMKTLYYEDNELSFDINEYETGGTYISIVNQDGELFDDLTINLPDVFRERHDEIFINPDIPDELVDILLDKNILTDTLEEVRYNYIQCKKMYYDKELIKEYQSKYENEYVDIKGLQNELKDRDF